MDILKKFFPHAFKATELGKFIVTLIIYFVIDIVCGAVIGLAAMILAGLPLIGGLLAWAVGVIGSLVGLYALVGVILSILVFVKVIK